jgi:uncharacterized protein (DUF2336 family)
MSAASTDLSAMLTDDLSGRSADECSRIVRKLAALFLREPERYSAAQVELLDSVLAKLISRVDQELRAYVAERMGPIANAPRGVIRNLAEDEQIAVAGPVLTLSPCLDEEFLVAIAKTRGQEHLVAISTRASIGDRITDILVDRGNDQVALTLAGNDGARLSERGRSVMLDRARNDQALAKLMCNRQDIPRQQILSLIEKASAAVRENLELQAGAMSPQLDFALEHASRKVQEHSRDSSAGYTRACASVAALKQTGGLSERHISTFAREGAFEEVVVAISEMSNLPISETEPIVFDSAPDRLLILSRAIGLSWATLRQILSTNRRTPPSPPSQIEHLHATYQSIPREAAAKTLQFHQLRLKARGTTAALSD